MTSVYLTEPGSVLKQERGRLVVTRGGETLFDAPAVTVDQVVVLTGSSVTTPALHFLLEHGVELVILSGSGRFRGRLTAGLGKNVALRRQQYRRLEDADFRLTVAKAIVIGKIANCRARCREWDGGAGRALVASAAADLTEFIARAEGAASPQALRGIEGVATRRYFEVFREFVRPPWVFERRARRPPPDPVNALLSLLATCLHGACCGALEAAGLDPFAGFLHDEHYGRASLALDLMEEFRPLVSDAATLALLNQRLARPEHFVNVPNEGTRLTKEGWRVVMTRYDQRLRESVTPEGQKKATTYLKLIEAQARQLRAVIEGEAAAYEPTRAR